MRFSPVRFKPFFLLLFIFFSICNLTFSQPDKVISIPASGNSWIINNLHADEEIITPEGIKGWKDKSSVIHTFFSTTKTGELSLSFIGKVNSGRSEIEITLNGVTRKVEISNTLTDKINAGTFPIKSSGYQCVEIKGNSREGSSFAEITDILISGPASGGKVNYVKDDFYFGRRGPSVHLNYEIPEKASSVEWFYNELTIPEGNDVIGSFFMAIGFSDGYFGIQVNSESERRILFSVWSPWQTDKPGEIPEEYRIKLLSKGQEVISGEFGDEGSGGQSYKRYNWKPGTTYSFLLRGKPAENNSTDYTSWFYSPETKHWELIASFRRPKKSTYLTHLHSFLENFIPSSGYISRMGYYANQWVCDSSGRWFEITKARFTADATARKEARLDYSGGTAERRFFLRNCGFFNRETEIGNVFFKPENLLAPIIDFKNFK